MTWNKFRNNKVIVIMGNLLPLVSLLSLLVINNKVVSITYICIVSVYYILMLSLNNITTYIFPLKSIIVYTKYGNYFLIKHNVSLAHTSYYLYENKYWLFLTTLKGCDVIYFINDYATTTDNLNALSERINNELSDHFKLRGYDRDMMMREWDGITDDVIRREKTIDKVLK